MPFGLGTDLSLPSLDPTSLLQSLNLTSAASQKLTPQAAVVNFNPPGILTRKIQNFSDSIIQTNWNQDPKLAPYYFSIRQTDETGAITNDIVDSQILQMMGLNDWKYFFYIAPSSINIQNQFAINVSATNQGIIEEHNGVVFRAIQISGTTGILPAKTNRTSTKTSPIQQIAQSLFPAATSAVVGLVNQVSHVANAITGGNDNDLAKITSALDYQRTGWFQFWQLNNFLIAYAEAKKGLQGQDTSNLRLCFSSSKDNIAYVVTPVSFAMKRDVSNPLLYRYEIVLKSWDIIPNTPPAQLPNADIPTPDSQSIVASIAGVLTEARTTIRDASNVLKSAQTDLNSILNVYNQALLLYQDTAGIVSQVATFGDTFVSNRQALLLNSQRNQTNILSAINSTENRTTLAPSVTQKQITVIQPSQSLSASNSSALTSAGFNTASTISTTTPSGADKTDSAKLNITPQADTLIIAALSTDSFLDQTIDQLDIPTPIQSAIDTVRTKAHQLTAGDIISLNSDLQNLSDNYAGTIGAMDPTYAAIYGVPFLPNQQTAVPTENDIITAVALQDAKTAFTSTLSTGQFFLERDADPFLYSNQFLPATDQLHTPQSSIAVPFQRGATLDTLAQQYLGNARRSREIAILNNLRAPFIDEIGFSIPLLGVSGRSFVVTEITRLAIGQNVTIQSSTQIPTKRIILNIEPIGNEEWQVTVDGLPNLAIYTAASNPILFAHLPGTVGPGDTILIPSDVVPTDFAAIRPTTLYNSLASAEKVFKVDMALDALNAQDLSVGANGDIQFAFGYTNAVQALRLALEVQRGELDEHVNYGLAVPVGSRNSDLDMDQVESAIQASIVNDPRFVNAEVQVGVDGSKFQIAVTAQGASGTGQIPVNFEIGLAG